VRRAPILVHGHAFRREFLPSDERMDALARVTILLESGRVVPPLMVQHHDVGAFANLLQISEGRRLRADGSAVHSGPDAIRSARGLRHPVVEFPEFGATLVVPHDPLAIDGIIPVGRAGNSCSGLGAELALAVGTIANAAPAGTGPTVVRHSLALRSLND